MSNGKVILEKDIYDSMQDKISSLGIENEKLRDEKVSLVTIRFEENGRQPFGFRDVSYFISEDRFPKHIEKSLEAVFGNYADLLNELNDIRTQNEKLKKENDTMKDIKSAISHFNRLNGGINE